MFLSKRTSPSLGVTGHTRSLTRERVEAMGGFHHVKGRGAQGRGYGTTTGSYFRRGHFEIGEKQQRLTLASQVRPANE